MNSTHAEIIVKLMRFLEAFDEIAVVHGSFEDSIGAERLHTKFSFEMPIDAAKPKKKREET